MTQAFCLITQYFSFLQSLPAPVKRRLKALKRIQLESTKIEAKFYEEVHKLECKYHEMYKPLYDQRAKITKGKHFFKKLCDLIRLSFVANGDKSIYNPVRIFIFAICDY